MKIDIENGKAYVYTPYNQEFVKAIKKVGGAKWNGEAWVVPEVAVSAVREIMLNIYGETDIDHGTNVDIKITFLESFSKDKKGITLFGKTIATATGRNSGARIGDDVAFIKGSPYSGGSVKNWSTDIPKDSICMVYNVPQNMIESEDVEGLEVEIIRNEASIEDLKREKERLLLRIAEIDKLLAEAVD